MLQFQSQNDFNKPLNKRKLFNLLALPTEKRCQKWDSNPRLENQTATWTQRLRPLGHPDYQYWPLCHPDYQYWPLGHPDYQYWPLGHPDLLNNRTLHSNENIYWRILCVDDIVLSVLPYYDVLYIRNKYITIYIYSCTTRLSCFYSWRWACDPKRS